MEGGIDQWMCPTDREEYKFYETLNYTKCFAFIKDSGLNWSDAQKYCRNSTLPATGGLLSGAYDKGELVSVPDQATNNFIESVLVGFGIKKLFWTGGMMNDSNEAWMWSDEMSHTPWNYSNWDPHDKEFSFVDKSKTPHGVLKKTKLGFRVDGKWNSLPSQFSHPFICQWTYQSITKYFLNIKMFSISIFNCSDSSAS